MAKTPKKKSPTEITSIRHTKDTRVNIPTEELRDFVADEEKTPKAMLYPRDPSLDPQLVWKGKDEQDQSALEVPVVPIYIQEKVHPQALVENLRRSAASGFSRTKDEPEPLTLFSDFNGMEDAGFDKKVDFYHHDQHWSNRMILGDSLLVMTSLAEKEGLKGKVQTIYFDPPYGIKFGSNWQVSTRKRDVKDGKVEDATRQPEQVRAFRDTWKLGVHSYLAYMRDRLVVARDLLTESGSIFVQIGDENVHLVRSVLDEVFGSENCIGNIAVQKTTSSTQEYLPQVADYLLWYSKNHQHVKYRPLFLEKSEGAGIQHYTMLELSDGTRRGATAAERAGDLPSRSRLFTAGDLQSAAQGREKGEGAACWFPIEINGRRYLPSAKSRWKTNEDGIARLLSANRIVPQDSALRFVRYIDDFPAIALHNMWTDVGGAPDKRYVVETAPRVTERCLLMTTDPGDLVLDPTCGSGTTAHVAEEWGRRWITIDTSRVALALARTRLMGAKYPYYLLADSAEGVRREAEVTGKIPPEYKTDNDIRKGFVYKRVPHVTLKSIANNPEIKKGMSREEIDAAIQRHADTELLYDKPYEDNKRIRVSGPFTVESLSPHRVLATDEDRPAGERDGQRDSAVQFEQMILDNLRKSGVQNTVKNERLVFTRLEAYPGQWIQAAGEYNEDRGAGAPGVGNVGKSRRVAVSIGPEHGTVGPQHVKEAAKEAVQGVGFDVLVVCGFAFDPHVSEEAKRYGKLTVLVARMNPDLSMGDELLKKTGAGNLFMVFGEPDITIMPSGTEGDLAVEIRGVDVYDPTTGQIRSNSTDDIACWFIDTDYNGESFFVRHAYFTGGDEPYEKLKRALRAEIDEGAWSTLYSTVSRPFPPPETGKIAVKVINHYGDEVLKVYDVVNAPATGTFSSAVKV
jgi:adenine-specific DNA-methyltransferase